MKNKSKLLIALSMAAVKATTGAHAGSFVGDDLANVVHRCAYYTELERDDLQLVLEQLLEERPEDNCIPFIVDLLGGAPLAQVLADAATAASGNGGLSGDNDDPNEPLILPDDDDDDAY